MNKNEIKRQIDEFKPDIIMGLGLLNAYTGSKLAKKHNIPFVLSNIISKNNEKIINKPLKKFLDKNADLKAIPIHYHYRSASYNKKNRQANEKEIIIVSKSK